MGYLPVYKGDTCLFTLRDMGFLVPHNTSLPLNNVFCVYTEIMAQDDTVTFE